MITTHCLMIEEESPHFVVGNYSVSKYQVFRHGSYRLKKRTPECSDFSLTVDPDMKNTPRTL